MGRGTTDEARLPRGDAAAAGFFRGAPPAGLRDLANLRGAASGSRFRELRRADPGNPKRPPREPFWNARPVGRSRATVQTVPCRSHARSEGHEGTGPGERGGSRPRSIRFPIGRSRTILERSLERMLSPRAYVPGSCLEIRSVRVQAVIGSVPSSKHSRMELKQRMGNRMERSGMGLETPSWAARSRVTLEAGLENRMERFLRSRDGGRADERSKRFRETATRICAPPVRTSPRRPPRQCPGRRPRTPTASPQGKIRPPVPRPRTGGSALIPASSPGSASAPRPSTRGAPPSHRRSTSS